MTGVLRQDPESEIARGADAPTAERPGEAQGPGRLLLLDPDASRLEALRASIADSFEVETRTAEELSLRAVRESAPEVLIVGDRLLGTAPQGFFEALHTEPRSGALAVLVALSEERSSEGAQFLESGADDVLLSRMSARELQARIKRSIRQTRMQQRLVSLAQTDALTGLPNFRWLRLRLEQEFKRANRYAHPLAAVMLDLDLLKSINDRFGHDVGNRAIQTFATYLQSSLREVDFAARFGGDEFVVLLPHQSAQEARVFAERLRQGLEAVRLVDRDGETLPIVLTTSVGIADHLPPNGKPHPEALLRAADRALYSAKRAGRNTVAMDGLEH